MHILNTVMTATKRYNHSKQRDCILSILSAVTTHPDAKWIHQEIQGRFPGTSLATVYRNLGILQEQGRIRVIEFSAGHTRYDADISDHCHFVCSHCGVVQDIPLKIQYDSEVLAHALEGHLVYERRFDIVGLCPSCYENVKTEIR